jgi:uncharacterized protein
VLVLSRYVVAGDTFVEGGADYRLVMSTRSRRTLKIRASLLQQVEGGDPGAAPEPLRTALREASILVPREEDELAKVLEEAREVVAGNRTLSRIIQPTSACQLACDYCGQEHGAAKLSKEDQDLLVEEVGGRLAGGRYDVLAVGWFGGEPLLGLDVIRRLTPLLRGVAGRHGCRYRAGVTTNGVGLSTEVAAALVGDLGVDTLVVTLDGPADVHDARRPTKGGGPSFRRVLDNLTAIAGDEHWRLELRCNVDGRNADRVPELIEALAASPLRRRAHLAFRPVHDWGNQAGAWSLPTRELAEREIEWLASMAARGLAVTAIPAPRPAVCFAITPDARLIDPRGQVFNCTDVPLVPAYGEPNRYALGTLRARRESPDAEALRGFLGDVERGKYECHACPILPLCGGACPKAWHEGGKPCPTIKYNLKERLLLAHATQRLNVGAAAGATAAGATIVELGSASEAAPAAALNKRRLPVWNPSGGEGWRKRSH